MESQNKDKKSLYNTVKKLIALHKAYPQFSYGADLEVKNDGYPLEFFRTANHESIYIAINPTDKEYTLSYVGKEILPTIEGVVVVAEGGGNATIVSQISKVAMALFPIEAHKIIVVKMSQGG